MNPDDQWPATKEETNKAYSLVAMAASARGLAALSLVLSNLPENFPAAVTVVQHLDPRHNSLIAVILGKRSRLRVKQAQEGNRLAPGSVFIAPPDRHLLVNPNDTLSLSQSELVHSVRPSADLLFESAAASFKKRAIAVVLSGTGIDGSLGIRAINN